MTSLRRCAACQQLLDPSARATQRFCAAQCRHRAKSRTRRGLPEADPPSQSTGLDLGPELRKRDRQLAGKERTISRLRASRSIARAQARTARAEADAETRRADRAIESVAAGNLQLRKQNAALRQQVSQLRQQVAEVAGAAEEIAGLRHQLAEVSAGAALPRDIRRQWEALAVRIARQASGSKVPLAGLDHEVVTTYQRHLKQAQPSEPTGQQAGKRPAAAPARRRPAARAAARPPARPTAPSTIDRTQP